jgi:nitrite reductase/ring-hydroxylating ferredoxin subunit
MTDYVVAAADELGAGERIVVQLEGREVGVFNLDGEYYAYLNWCAHQSGPVCEGITTGTWETATFDRETLAVELEWSGDGEVLNCPWHGWEFELRTGECLSKCGVTLPSYPTRVEDGDVVVTL